VHPRDDERHIRSSDVTDIAACSGPAVARRRVEFNIEGDPRRRSSISCSARPDQCTLVPATPGEITSQAGWPADTSPERLSGVIRRLKAPGFGSSVFVDPEEAPVRWAARLGADRIELYTEPFARAFAAGEHPGGRRFPPTRRRRARASRSASASTRATTSISTTSCLFRTCRPGRSVDRPRADQPRDLGRARPSVRDYLAALTI
jgi:pyridoxine 5'-phosphate synthase PdxJ